MSIVLAILGVLGGGVAGSAVAYGLTWRRENRRTNDAYRAPQREAVAGILSAGYELQLAIQALCEASELAAQSQEGNVPEATAHAALDAVGDQPNRALLGIGTAFNIGRITIVDAECYEAMGKAFNEFAGLRDTISGVGDEQPTQRRRTSPQCRPGATSASAPTSKNDLRRSISSIPQNSASC